MIRISFISSLLTIGLSEFQICQARAEVIWKPVETPLAQPTPVIWETTISDPEEQDEAPVDMVVGTLAKTAHAHVGALAVMEPGIPVRGGGIIKGGTAQDVQSDGRLASIKNKNNSR